LLRDILESGFCGSYSIAGGGQTRGRVRFKLDLVAASNMFLGCDQEWQRVQVCNSNVISYEDQPFFHKCLEGLLSNGSYFNPTDHEWVHDSVSVPSGDEVQFIASRDKSTGTFIEPVYDYVSMQDYIPMHSIICAYLMGIAGPISVDCISVMSGPFSSKVWAIDRAAIEALLASWFTSKVKSEARKPSGACASCSQSACVFQSPFEHLTYDWMKAKQTIDAIEAKIREHITYNGPTKVGAHLVYMKESKRRSLNPAQRDQFLELLKKERPNDWLDFMNPDAAEIAKLVAKKKLPQELLAAFKESRYYTLDTTLTL
jgi:hypothetical protein